MENEVFEQSRRIILLELELMFKQLMSIEDDLKAIDNIKILILEEMNKYDKSLRIKEFEYRTVADEIVVIEVSLNKPILFIEAEKIKNNVLEENNFFYEIKTYYQFID